MFIAVHVVHGPPEPMLWILTAGWPLVYGCVLGISLTIMSINHQGPLSSHWPGFLCAAFPAPLRSLLDRFYRLLGPMALIAFPLFVFGMAALFLWLELTGQMKPGAP